MLSRGAIFTFSRRPERIKMVSLYSKLGKFLLRSGRAKGMEIFILFSGGQGGLCKVNRGPQAAATRRVQKFSKQKSRRLRNAWDGVEPHPDFLS